MSIVRIRWEPNPRVAAVVMLSATQSQTMGVPFDVEYGEWMAAEPGPSESFEPVLGERFERALQFAVAAHRTQVRKGSGIPYVGHLLGVCSLVIEDGGSEDEAIGALLHDAVEDQGGQRMLDDIRVRFGNHVAAIVEACSDTIDSPKPPWQARKDAYLKHLDHQSESVLRVSLADKLFNARAILRDYRVHGEKIWERFRSGRDGQLWYYRQLADRFSALVPGPMASDLSDVVDELEQTVIAH
jgi:(p)ppGpp synthase/HD superfamily hydrolase